MADPEYQQQLAIFEALFHDYHAKLHRYACTLLKDEDQASDIVQQVFVRLWEKREKVVMGDAIRGYLYRAVYTLCLNYIRDGKTKAQYIAHAGRNMDHIVEDKLQASELSNRINIIMESLPPQCRLVFVKSRIEGKKYAEIAAEMNISVKTVEAQIGKALSLFRSKLADYLVLILMLALAGWYKGWIITIIMQ